MKTDISWLRNFLTKQQTLIAAAPATLSAKLKEALSKQNGQMTAVLAGLPADEKTENITGEVALVLCGNMAQMLEDQNAMLLGFDGEVDARVKVVLAGRVEKGELVEKATHESLIAAAKESGRKEEEGRQKLFGERRQAIVLAGLPATEDREVLGLEKEKFELATTTAKTRKGQIDALKVKLPANHLARLLWGSEDSWTSQFELVKAAAGEAPGDPFNTPRTGDKKDGEYPPM